MPDKKPTILIVEDEVPLARVLAMKFNKIGFNAKAVYNGEKALEIIERNHFDLILLDLIMPEIDGFTVLEKLAKKKPMPKVIVISNLGQEADIDKVKKMGACDFFVKSSMSISEIVQNIKKIMNLN